MKIVYNNIIPFRGFKAINLLGVLFARKSYKPLKATSIRHERIHTKQMINLLFVGFYVWYVLEWALKGFNYDAISFERQAYANQDDENFKYKFFSFIKYI